MKMTEILSELPVNGDDSIEPRDIDDGQSSDVSSCAHIVVDSLFERALSCLTSTELKKYLNSLVRTINKRNKEISSLEEKLSVCESGTSQEFSELTRRLHAAEDILQTKLSEFEQERETLKAEKSLAEEKLRKHDESAKRAIQSYQQDITQKLSEASKQVEDIRKDRESAVMRFAQAEQHVIDSKNHAEKLESQLKLAMKEKDFFQEKIKMLGEEKRKMQLFIDHKTVEVTQLQKDVRDSKESVKDADRKVMQAVAKSKSDQDSCQEMRLRMERVQQQLIEVKTELENTKQNLSEKELQHKNDIQQNVQLRQQENFQQRLELAEINEKLRFELESLKQKHRDTLEENITLNDQVRCLDSELGYLKTELEKTKSSLASLQEEAESYREEAILQRDRASELLNHNQQLSTFRSQIQAEVSGLKENLGDIQHDYAVVSEENNRLKQEATEMFAKLTEERRSAETSIEHLKTELSTVKKTAREASSQLQEKESLLISARKKYNREVKELQRQLRGQQHNHDAISEGGTRGISRASSNNSDLDNINGQQQLQTSPPVRNEDQTSLNSLTNGDQHIAVIVGGNSEVSRQHMMDKIVHLQKTLAKKCEHVDFLSEQTKLLTDEVQKKSRIIQILATRDSAENGAFTSDKTDKHKASMARRSGIMASVYSASEASEGKMTLDLSLEITRKLQEVLEETLLKNMMLKESLDTLGHEISHLSKENRDLKLTMKGVLADKPGVTSR